MLNLLFISSLPKASALKDVLQPRLKAKIDLVEDFDLGLKSVFEKRPSVVVIQEQIAGVSGESVVRHIQMLLGDDAPRFILLADGGEGSRPSEGLFSFRIGGDASEQQLSEQILDAVRQMFGEQWAGMIPAQKKGASAEERAVADNMVSDLLSEIKESGPEPENTAEQAAFGEPPGAIRSTADEMASLLIKANLEAAREAARSSSPPVPVMEEKPSETGGFPEPPPTPIQGREKTVAQQTGIPSGPPPSPKPAGKPVESVAARPVPPPSGAAPEPAKRSAQPDRASTAAQRANSQYSEAAGAAPKSASPAAFRVNAGKTPEKEPIPEELLLEFEKNFRARSHGLRNALIAATAVCLLGGGFWWWNSQVPSPETAKRTASAPHSGPAQETMPRKAVAPPAAQPPVAAPSPRPEPLPSFVPSREDVSYASARPGWQRYVDSERDVRIFRSGGSIKAVQVVSVPGKILDDTQLAAVLKELTGSSDRILGKSEKRKGYRGYLIQQGTAGAGAELVVYRRQHPEGIVAFVVSLK